MKIVVTFAVKEEVIDVPLKDAIIVPIVTGIGKANAAFSLTRTVLLEKPDMVRLKRSFASARGTAVRLNNCAHRGESCKECCGKHCLSSTHRRWCISR